MKKVFFTGLLALGVLSFTPKEEIAKETPSYEFGRVCILWEITTVVRPDGPTSSSSKCIKFKDVPD